jgi:dipeptidyl aminopeptidase/acylaminoacyl peptidase
VSDLDTLARAATRELLERSTPDVSIRYAELKRIRTRRTTAKVVAVAVAVAIAAGGWRLGSEPDRIDPAPPPGNVLNGTIVSAASTLKTVAGTPTPFRPGDLASYAQVQFTADGRSVVYPDARGQVVMTDVTDGTEVVLARCTGGSCDMDLSPDGELLAISGNGGILVQPVGAESGELLAVAGAGFAGSPSWSPDASEIAFTTEDGVYVMAADGSDLRLVHEYTDPPFTVTGVSWAPDGSRLAFFDSQAVGTKSYPEARFTAMTIRPDGTDLTGLHGAGSCVCLGLTPPYLTWSPDSQFVAVATTKGSGPWGVYVVHPDGTGWERVASGSFGHLAWQPVID